MPRITIKRKPQVDDSPETIAQALKDLELDRPYYLCRVVGGRLEFSLYGGEVVVWPPDKES